MSEETHIKIGDAVDAPLGTPTFYMRHNTQDYEVYDQVIVKNQYQLPDSISSDSVIIDIGANIGTFAVACLLRGAGTVVCFEPFPDNYKSLIANVSYWPNRVPCFNAAVWRSDRNEKIKFVVPGINTACGAVVRDSATIPFLPTIDVAAIGLDEVIYHITDDGKTRINILKIDAESSEYPILYTCNKLDLVDEILLETHEYPEKFSGVKYFVDGYPDNEACADGMESFLIEKGFLVTKIPESETNGINHLLFAKRKSKCL